jgi:tetratricopeptide (TPR) repeat protein
MPGMDPDNPVVKLCVAGMRAEGEGRLDEAAELFRQAWAARRDDVEACIAAHYVARHQPTPEETLRWNEAALAAAEAAGGERVQGFYASLYLNLGHAHEALGHTAEARRFYDLAAGQLQAVPEGRYGEMVRGGIEQGRLRVNGGAQS